MGMASSLVMGVAWGLGGVMVIITGKLADTFGILPTLNIMALLPIAAFLLSLVLHRQTIKEETQYPYI
jgi:fucose permease